MTDVCGLLAPLQDCVCVNFKMCCSQATNEIIITERNPTHQVQIYTKDGRFVRRFATNQLQHPRGIAVDHSGRIVIVESKVGSSEFVSLHGVAHYLFFEFTSRLVKFTKHDWWCFSVGN